MHKVTFHISLLATENLYLQPYMVGFHNVCAQACAVCKFVDFVAIPLFYLYFDMSLQVYLYHQILLGVPDYSTRFLPLGTKRSGSYLRRFALPDCTFKPFSFCCCSFFGIGVDAIGG